MPGYNYNASNQLTSTSSGSYTYDANGNTLTDAQGRSFTWDFENRLTQVVNPGVGTTTFRYDPFGRRIQKSGPLGTTNYLYDGHKLIEELDNSGNVLARYTQGAGVDRPLAESRSGVTSYYDQGGLDSVSSLSNSSGALANTYVFDSFGQTTASTGTLTNPFQYTGREFDSETGVYFYRARYYDAKTGRFISEDPSGFEGGMDFYAYTGNNPATLTDPFGLQGPGTITPPVTQPYPGEPPPGAVDEVINALEAAGRGASSAASTAAAAALGLLYLLDPSGSNNTAFANSAEGRFERECKNGGPNCVKASPWHLSQARIDDPHEFKKDFLGNKAPISNYDICACKDGSIVIKAQGQFGKPGPGIDTGYSWK